MESLPNELDNIIKDYVIFKPKTKDELQEAVDLWCDNKENALARYGHISLWNTILITDMSKLFYGKKDFNDNINNWNVSNVTNMHGMFYKASSFNQPLDSWDVSSVTYMGSMFKGASSFNQNINSWKRIPLDNLPPDNYFLPRKLIPNDFRINMNRMFEGASSFDRSNALWYN